MCLMYTLIKDSEEAYLLSPSSFTYMMMTEYAFPAKFTIGFPQIELFVDIAQLKGHLALLNELAELRLLLDRLG